MENCSDNLLDFNFNFGDRQERIRNIIFRNGLNATLMRSIPCSGHDSVITNELQTFAQQDHGLNSDLIIKRENTIILDGETDLLGNTTFWDEPNTYVVTSSVSVTGVRNHRYYEYIGSFNGININFNTDNSNIIDGTFDMYSATLTITSTSLTSNVSIGDWELEVSSTLGFSSGDYIVIDKDAVNHLDVELFQIKHVTGHIIVLRTPTVEQNIFSPNGLVRDHISGTSIYKVNIDRKVQTDDYNINLTSGVITIVASKFINGDLIFFNYENETLYPYSDGTDYDIDYEEGIITRLESGNIPFGETVEVNYNFSQPCLDPKTGAPRRSCIQCNGFGFISLPPEQIRGLFHIPNYDSPLMQAGFFQMGDAFFTVPELSTFNDITAEPKGIEGFFVRDMLIIDNKYWLVMTKPQSFNLQNQFLGRKLHLRMISE